MASREPIELSCRCLAWADMCKHVAAVLYGAGATAKRAVPGTDEPANDAQGMYPPRDGDLELTGQRAPWTFQLSKDGLAKDRQLASTARNSI